MVEKARKKIVGFFLAISPNGLLWLFIDNIVN